MATSSPIGRVGSKGHHQIPPLCSRTWVVTLAPADASLAVDGAPLVAEGKGWVAVSLRPASQASLPERGSRLRSIRARASSRTRKGFQDVVVR